MEYQDVVKQRHSIRRYQDRPIEKETLEAIVEAGFLAPTSRNLRPCHFYVVENKEILEQLSHAKKSGAQFLKDAAAAIVVGADRIKSDTYVEDAAIALTMMHLMATNCQVGSCWVQIHLRSDENGVDAESRVRAILNIDENIGIIGILSLGYPLDDQKHKALVFDRRVIHYVNQEEAK